MDNIDDPMHESRKAKLCIKVLDKAIALKNADLILALSSDIHWETWSVDNLLMDLPGKWDNSLCIEEDNRVIAYAIVSRKDTGLHVHHIVVHNKYRGQGLGRLLIERLIYNCQLDHTIAITLRVYSDDLKAMKFYRKLGFKVCGNTITGQSDMKLSLRAT